MSQKTKTLSKRELAILELERNSEKLEYTVHKEQLSTNPNRFKQRINESIEQAKDILAMRWIMANSDGAECRKIADAYVALKAIKPLDDGDNKNAKL